MSVHPIRKVPDRQPVALHDRAMDNLRFIRETMERSASFTAVSGWAGVFMGCLALATAWIARGVASPETWLAVWMGTAALSAAVATWAMAAKARRVGMSLLNGAGRKFALSFLPAIFVGGVLTLVLIRQDLTALLPGSWLLLYGAAVVSGGQFSVRTVPITGGVFLLVGTAALLAPPAWGDAFMALGFGGIHIVSGLVIARQHGG